VSVIATALKHLIAAGVSGDDLVRAVAEMEAAQPKDAAAEKRRAWDRERKREERLEAKRLSTGLPPESADSADNVDQPPSLDKSPQTPKINPTPHTHEGRARKADPFPKPDWAESSIWADLLTNRRKKNLPNTPSAHRKLLADIDRLTDDAWPPGRVLEAAVSRGWGAIYAGCKDDDDGPNQTDRRANGNGRMGGPKPDPLLAIRRLAGDAIARSAGDH
jgi:hypothetical protein